MNPWIPFRSRHALGFALTLALIAGSGLSGCAGGPHAGGGGGAGQLRDLYPITQVPDGIRRSESQNGPVFTDARGMTLYAWIGGPGTQCSSVQDPLSNASPLQLMLAKSSPTCAQQWPPWIVPPAAVPVGDWTIVSGPEGIRQWAYLGRPVHLSYKDRLPGDINPFFGAPVFGDGQRPGMFVLAQPVAAIPPALRVTSRLGAGIVATTADGRQLYTRPALRGSDAAPKKFASAVPDNQWSKVSASALAQPIGPWLVRAEPDGERYWTFRGQPLFVFSGDVDPYDIRGMDVDGAKPLLLVPESSAPDGVEVRRNVLGPVFTDASGMTLYYFHCTNPNPAGPDAPSGGGFSCDNWNDDPAFAEMYCPARDRCGEMWKPFAAPASAPVRGGVWSMVAIPDPVLFPLRWVPIDHVQAKRPGAIRVWTYRGHPLYASVYDRGPAQLRGHDYNMWSGSIWRALLASGAERSK